jgi:hypothetical protein
MVRGTTSISATSICIEMRIHIHIHVCTCNKIQSGDWLKLQPAVQVQLRTLTSFFYYRGTWCVLKYIEVYKEVFAEVHTEEYRSIKKYI